MSGDAPEFQPSVSRLVAADIIGDVPRNSIATFTWSSESADGESTLLVQQVDAASHSLVFATAINSGQLAEGLYRVHLTVAGEEHDSLFIVTVEAPAARLTASRSVPPTGDEGPGGLTNGSTGTSDKPPCEPPEGATGPGHCEYWEWVPDPDPNAPTTTLPCLSADKWTYLRLEQELAEPGGWVEISTETHSTEQCPLTPLELSASVNAAGPALLGTDSGVPSDTNRLAVNWSGSTCRLPGASDVVGDTVTATASVADASTKQEQVTLAEFGPIPGAVNVSPSPGLVQPGTTISFDAIAVVMAATRGIKSLIVSGPDGAELGRTESDRPVAACSLDLRRYVTKPPVHVAYHVTESSPPLLVFKIAAETFDGGKNTLVARWATRPAWSGRLRFTVDQDVTSGHQHMELNAEVAVGEAEHGLQGEIDGEWEQTLDLEKCPATTITPGLFSAPLTGTVDSTGIHLTLGAVSAEPPILTPCFGRQPGIMGQPDLYEEFTTLLSRLDPQGNGMYHGERAGTHSAGGAPYHVAVDLTLKPGVQPGEGP